MTRITDAVARGCGALLLALSALPAMAAGAPEALWQLIDKLAAASTQGGKAVVSQWPGKSFSLRGAGEIGSGPFMLAPQLQSALAEVRLAEGDAVQLMVLELQGSCITPADIHARYAQVGNADFPQPDNPDPVSYRRVQIDGVRVSFGFRGAPPGCLSHVVFNPQAH
jgi:hypothetical protein